MGPLDLALMGPTIFGGVGDSINSGAQAGKDGDWGKMRRKELVGGALIVGIGVVMAIREKAVWPLVAVAVTLAVLVGLHEYQARQSASPDLTLVIGGFK